jgi:putative flippase GtrA
MNNIIKFGAKYKEILFYIVFGVLTTAVNWIIFQICIELFSINWSIANVIAWVGAVIFAYITNRKIVFESSSPHIIKEFMVFVQFRLLSLGIEMAIMFVFIEVLFIAPFPSKIVTSVVVVIANYIFSKAVIFKKRG